MKKTLIICAALCLFATSAFASGINLTVTACPGVAGSRGDAGTLDCAAGQIVTMLATFQPVEALTDLVGLDAILDITINGDVSGPANFWDFAVANTGALGTDHKRPTTGCTPYNNVWNVGSAGSAAAGAVRGPGQVRLAASVQRPSFFVNTANQKLFGFQMSVDASTSAEGGGSANGCATAAGIVLEQIIPASSAGTPTTTLTSPDALSGQGQSVLFNGATLPTKASRHSWGQLKSLYR